MFNRKKSFELKGSSEVIIGAESQNTLSDEPASGAKRKWWTPYIGVIYAILCSITILLTSVFVKKLTYINPGQLSMVRNLGVLAGNLPIAIYCTKNILGPKKHFWLLLIRGFLGATALYLNLMAFRLLPLTEASIILATVPALVTIAARVHLKEPCGFAQVFSIFLTLLGVLLSIRLPEVLKDLSNHPFTNEYIAGLGCAIGCVLILTFTFVTLRKMTDVHFSVVLIYFGALGAIENFTLTYSLASFEWSRCGGWDAIEVTLIGIFGFMGHCFLTLAIQKEAAGIVSTCKAAADIAVAAIFQIIFFDSIPDYYTFGGGFLVIIAITIQGLWKWLTMQPANSIHRKRMRWLLI